MVLAFFVFVFEHTCTDVDQIMVRAQELCESRGGRPGLLIVSVEVKQH